MNNTMKFINYFLHLPNEDMLLKDFDLVYKFLHDNEGGEFLNKLNNSKEINVTQFKRELKQYLLKEEQEEQGE